MTNTAGFQYPGVWTGSTANMPSIAPLSTDSILVNGSLVLIDPSDPNYSWAVGTPSSGSYLPNLAWDRAASLIGANDANNMGCPYSNTLTGASESIFERSAKGGLHGIVSQVNSSVNTHNANIRAAAAIEAYIYANLGHSYFLSLWETVDRAGTVTSSPIAGIYSNNGGNAPATANYEIYFQSTTTTANSGNATLGSRLTTGALYRTGGPSIINGAASAFSGTVPSSAANTVALLGIWGNIGAYGPVTVNKAASKTLYRVYLEDLTVSGRSYATVDGLDVALWTAAFASGGKFNGDTTPTAPASLP